jgi:L-threonylcarbamoyladenylate synthase
VKIFKERTNPEVISILNNGGIGIIGTDTLYGIVARANDASAVERLYTVRKRDPNKACIVLIADPGQIWDKEEAEKRKDILEEHWPGPVSIILPASEKSPFHVHRGVGSIAFRVPADDNLRQLLFATGPLVAPSANPEGEIPADSVHQAIRYFGEMVDFYVDSGVCQNVSPSRLIRVEPDGSLIRLR